MILDAFIKKVNDRRLEHKHARELELARELFQICEHDGQIWLTYNGERVIPESMLNIDAIHALAQLREMYLNDLCNARTESCS